MLTIKVSTPWNHIDFNTRVRKDIAGSNYVFDFSEGCKECDFWIVWGGIKTKVEKAYCPAQNIIYITDEIHEQRTFNQSFITQFAAVLTYRTDIKHKKIISPVHELNTWLVDRDIDFLMSEKKIKKSKNLSVVCSDQTWLPGHKLRFAFVNKLIGHFKDRIDVFGRGFNFINDKYDALAPYKYSVAIENASIPGYFTEKIADCYLTDTMPVYYGCPDIAKYFDPKTFLLIDPTDFITSISKIEELLDEDPYGEVLPILQAQKKTYLQELHIFSKLLVILEGHFQFINKKELIVIKNEKLFENSHNLFKWVKKISK